MIGIFILGFFIGLAVGTIITTFTIGSDNRR